MKSIATITLGGTLPEKLFAASAAGFSGIEIVEKDFLTYQGTPRDIRQLCHDLGLEIIALQPMRDFEGCPREQLKERLTRVEEMFDVMGELGTKTLLLCSNVSSQSSSDPGMIADDLHLLVERAKRRGLRIGYEALSWGAHTRTFSDAAYFVERVSDPSFGLVLDTFHTFALNDDFTGILNLPPERIFFVQLADAPRVAIDLLTWSRTFRCLPGVGEFALPSFLRQLNSIGYKGPLSLEVFSSIYPTLPPGLVASLGYASLEALEVAALALETDATAA